jgi:hypothetical protein
MKTDEFIERVKSVIAAWHERTKGKKYDRGPTLQDFRGEIRRLQDGVDRFEAGGPAPKRTSYSAEEVARFGDPLVYVVDTANRLHATHELSS